MVWGRIAAYCLAYSTAMLGGGGLLTAQPPAYEIPDPAGQQVFTLNVEDGLSQGVVTDLYRDSRGFLWIGTHEGLNRYDGQGFKVFRHRERDSTTLYGNLVFGIVEDSWGDIWIGTELCLNRYRRHSDLFDYHFPDTVEARPITGPARPIYADSTYLWYMSSGEGLCRLDFRSGEKSVFEVFSNYRIQPGISDFILRDDHGRFWFREDSGMRCFDPANESSQFYFSNRPDNLVGASAQVHAAVFDKEGMMWLGVEQGLWRLDTAERKVHATTYDNELSGPVFRIASCSSGAWWLVTASAGLCRLTPATGELVVWNDTPDCPLCPRPGKDSDLIVDEQGIVWVSIPPSGLNKIIPWPKPFQNYLPAGHTHRFSYDNSILALEESADGKVWIALADGRVSVFDPEQESSRILPASLEPADSSASFRCLLEEDGGRIWGGTNRGLFFYDRREQQWKQLLLAGSVPAKAVAVNDLLEWSDSLLLVAAADGVYSIHSGNLHTRRIEVFGEGPVHALAGSNAQQVMAATGYEGFRLLQLERNGDFRLLEEGLHGYQINAFWRSEAREEWWLATNKGLCYRRDGEESWNCYLQQGGLASEYIHAILEDEQGNIWVSTNQGLSKFDRTAEQFFSFGPKDGVQRFQFNSRAALKAQDGTFYFGGANGFNRFSPEAVFLDTGPSYPVYLTSLEVNEQPFRNQGYIGELESLRLNYRQNTLSFEFVALDYLSHGHNHYRYRLLGLNEAWTDLYHQNRVHYGKLPPGNYTFEVMAANDQMVWNPEIRRLNIDITAPWWQRWWAGLLFFLLLLAGALLFYRYWVKRSNIRKEAQQLRILDEIKNRFMTHITHAFRTPLTVITKPVVRAIQEGRSLEREELGLIYEHGEQLKYFIDELLDLRSIEAATMEVKYIYGDLVEYVQYLTDAFQGQAFAKNIELEFQAEQDYLLMNYDRKKIMQILSHLLSNAIKYTPPKEQVLVRLSRKSNWMKLQVSDPGPGIDPEVLPRIFDKFSHSDHEQYAGTGIGLTIVRELTQLLGGTVSVDSQPGQGACFTIRLPIKKGAPQEEEAPSPFSLPAFPLAGATKAEKTGGTMAGDKILIIEDNAAVRRLIAYCLKDRYSLAFAAGGKEGLDKAFGKIPNLVLCDIMMPEMNGYEVCRHLKEDERTSHIPVILLTALGDTDSRVKGLAAGADAYLAKPFDDRELQEQVKQLLLQRQRLQVVFQKQTAPTRGARRLTGEREEEDPFLLRFRAKVEKELANPDFSVPQLCKELGVSHTQLHRKLKAISGMSAIQMIKSIRMEKAKILLQDTDLSVGEIAYKTGYNDPSYFGRVFARYAGKSPSNYRDEYSG